MPIYEEPQDFTCPNCGREYQVKHSPFRCRCKTLAKLDGTVIQMTEHLGDKVRKVTRALHIPHCGGCEGRRKLLNRLTS